MRNPVVAVIGSESYNFGYLNTSMALEVATEVGLALLPALGKALPKSGKLTDLMDKELGDVDLSGAFDTLSKNLTPKQFTRIVQTLCSVVASSSGLLADQVYEEHFKGRTGDAIKVAMKSFSVNCGDFFQSVVGAVGLNRLPTTQAKPG